MSRLNMSADALKAMFSPESSSDLISLLTIYDPITPTTVIARLSDGFTQRLTTSLEAGDLITTDEEVIYGVVSNSKNYVFLPMQITLPSEDDTQAPRCSIVLNDVTRFLTPIIRTLTGPPKIKLDLILSSSPNTIEISFAHFYISSFHYNKDSVTCDLSMINYEREPFPMHSFNPPNFPGLF